MCGIHRIYSLVTTCIKCAPVSVAFENYGLRAHRRSGHFSIILLLAFATVALGTVSYAQQVTTPTFTPNGGSFYLEKSVTVNCATSGATIHYTTNGVTPTDNDRAVACGGT